MKPLLSFVVCSLTCAAVCGEFVNLTFDQPDLSRLAFDPSTGGRSAPVEDMVPGWEVSLRPVTGGGWQPYTGLVELNGAVGVTPVALSTGYAYGNLGFGVSMLVPWAGLPPGPRAPHVRISTKGTVPANALTFDLYSGDGLEVTVSDGVHTLSKDLLKTSMDVSPFAGKEVTISFLLTKEGSDGVDVIGFSLVPEPETWALLGVGLVGFFAWHQCKRL